MLICLLGGLTLERDLSEGGGTEVQRKKERGSGCVHDVNVLFFTFGHQVSGLFFSLDSDLFVLIPDLFTFF